jgi:hypothetical protein
MVGRSLIFVGSYIIVCSSRIVGNFRVIVRPDGVGPSCVFSPRRRRAHSRAAAGRLASRRTSVGPSSVEAAASKSCSASILRVGHLPTGAARPRLPAATPRPAGEAELRVVQVDAESHQHCDRPVVSAHSFVFLVRVPPFGVQVRCFDSEGRPGLGLNRDGSRRLLPALIIVTVGGSVSGLRIESRQVFKLMAGGSVRRFMLKALKSVKARTLIP